MQYTPRAAAFEDHTAKTARWVGGKVPLMPGIGASLGQRPVDILQQVLIARRHRAAGFVLFDYTPTLAEHTLPLLHLGATAEPTAWRPPGQPGSTTRP